MLMKYKDFTKKIKNSEILISELRVVGGNDMLIFYVSRILPEAQEEFW